MPAHTRTQARNSPRSPLAGSTLCIAFTAIAMTVGPVAADSDGNAQLSTISVTPTGTSQGRPISAVPGSVTVIEREDIEKQTRTTQDMGEILSNLVPGFGLSSESLTNFGQNLRGRSFLVMIDGVPQNAVLRQGEKHLRSIAPEAVERIEVIRGAVATYGVGSTGGIINFITKSGEGAGDPQAQTTVGVTGQDENSDSLGGRVYQGLRGESGPLDYSINLSHQDTGSWYDGDGDLIPPDGFASQGGGLAEATETNFQTKLGYQLSQDQRLRLAFNYFEHTQSPEHSRINGSGDPATDRPTRAQDGEPPGKDPGTENLNLSLDYAASNVLGGTLSAQLYHQAYETVFGYFAGYNPPGQTFLETEHTGGRITHDRALGKRVNAIYGLDLGREVTSQSFFDGRTSVGELEQTNLAPFLQLEADLTDNVRLRGGIRHERASVDVPTFQDEGGIFGPPGTVSAGEIEYDDTLFNLGAVYYLSSRNEIFASYSQGFDIADLGRELRSRSAAGTDVDADDFEPNPKVVDNYELGWRGYYNRWEATATAYYSTSDEGTTFGGPPDFPLQKQKENVYGVELTGEYQATDAWTLGGTASWQEGRLDTNDDGDVDEDLNNIRISAPKLTLFGEYEPNARWSTRLQALHVFDRDEFDNSTAFGEGEVNGYTLVDASVQTDVGPGQLAVGIDNLFDEQYITQLGQAYNLSNNVIAGRGRAYSLTYTMRY